jgi:hypothetical protein
VHVSAWRQSAATRAWRKVDIGLSLDDDELGNPCVWVEGGPIEPLYADVAALAGRPHWDALLMVPGRTDGLRVDGNELSRAIARLSLETAL